MKKGILSFIIVITGIMFYCVNVFCEETGKVDFSRLAGFNKEVAIDLRGMDVVDVLKFLGQKGNINIVATNEVTGKVSLFLKGVKIADALEIILLANNLAYEQKGDIIFVMTEDEYKAVHGIEFKDRRQIKTVKLTYARPEYIFKLLTALKTDMGKLAIDEESGVIVMVDVPDSINQMNEVIEKIDQPGITTVFPLQYAQAKDVQEILAKKLDAQKTGSVIADERNNQIIVRAFADRMTEAEGIIKELDKKTKEVLLEAKIIRVTLSDDFDMGIDWERLFRDDSLHSLDLSGTFPISSTASSYGTLTVGTLGADDFTATMQILKTFGQTKNLSSPSIAVVNKQEARIHIGTREVYVTTTTTTGQTTTTTAEEVTFLDVGVQLKVTPVINEDGYVTMKVGSEVSSVARTYVTPTGNEIPVVDTTEAETEVMVKDGTTIVIGGLRKDENIKEVKKFPILGDIPILGMAFRQTAMDTEKTELVVFLTPHIISGDKDVRDEEKKPKALRGYEVQKTQKTNKPEAENVQSN
ncbi:MAG: secretin N-terminal domain-containing protein [Candidatus Omnitrophota bacterium]